MEQQLTPNPKCPRCKCYWKPDETDIKSSGLYYKTCKKCRTYKRDVNLKSYHNNKNKEENINKRKEYYENNKELIYSKNSEKITCECGVEITTNGKSKHLKTKKHLTIIKKSEDEKQYQVDRQKKFDLYDKMIETKRQQEKINDVGSLFD